MTSAGEIYGHDPKWPAEFAPHHMDPIFLCLCAGGVSIVSWSETGLNLPRTSNYPRHPILPIHQTHGRVANVNAISNAIPPPDTKKPVKRQLNLHVSLKNKKMFFCNASFPVYNNHFLIRTSSIITKKQIIQRKNRPRSSPRLQPAQNFMQPPRRPYQLHREV